MAWHRFCPSEPDKCRGCETYPLTPEYEARWRDAAADGELSDEEEAEWQAYLTVKAESGAA